MEVFQQLLENLIIIVFTLFTLYIQKKRFGDRLFLKEAFLIYFQLSILEIVYEEF